MKISIEFNISETAYRDYEKMIDNILLDLSEVATDGEVEVTEE